MSASFLYPPLHIRDTPRPQPGQFGLLEKPYREQKNLALQNREYEAIREARAQQNQKAKTELTKIRFDELSSTKTFNAQVKREVGRRLNQADHQLEERRERLRDLFAVEDSQNLYETTSPRTENLTERIGKMRQKAKHIREERDTEHTKLVLDKYDQRFRRDCTELRELQSKELDQDLGNEHLWQIKEKIDRKTNQKIEDEFWKQLWYTDTAKKKEREDRDTYEAKGKSNDVAKVIREQIQVTEADRYLEKLKRKEYSDNAWIQFRAQKDEKIAEYQDKLRKQDQQRRVYDNVLATKQKVQQYKAQEEMALEHKLAEETQNATTSDDTEKRQRKFELYDENQRYLSYLQDRRFDERQKEIDLDRVLQIELDKQNVKRLDKVRVEKDKQNKILQDVSDGRYQQLIERNERKVHEQSEYQLQKDNVKNITKQVKIEDAEREARNKVKRANYGRELFGQINYEDRKKKQEEYENQREYVEGMEAEIEYQKRLSFELQQTGNINPHPIRQWYSAKTGTFYKPEKPTIFDGDNTFRSTENLNFLPQRNTSITQQSHTFLPVPVVYH